MVTARLADEDDLSAWCRYLVLLYGQVIDVAGDGRWFGRIGCKGWIIDVTGVQYFG